MRQKEVRRASVAGLYNWQAKPPGEPYQGSIQFEHRQDCVYYTVRLEREDGSFVAGFSRPVSKRVIPAEVDVFEYALQHALEGIRRYRVDRRPTFTVETWKWLA